KGPGELGATVGPENDVPALPAADRIGGDHGAVVDSEGLGIPDRGVAPLEATSDLDGSATGLARRIDVGAVRDDDRTPFDGDVPTCGGAAHRLDRAPDNRIVRGGEHD